MCTRRSLGSESSIFDLPFQSRRLFVSDLVSFFVTHPGCHPSPITTPPNDPTLHPPSPNQLPPLVPSPAVDDAPPLSLPVLLVTDPLSPFKPKVRPSRERKSPSPPSWLNPPSSSEPSRSRVRRERRERLRLTRRRSKLRRRGKERRRLSRGSWRCRRPGGARSLGGG